MWPIIGAAPEVFTAMANAMGYILAEGKTSRDLMAPHVFVIYHDPTDSQDKVAIGVIGASASHQRVAAIRDMIRSVGMSNVKLVLHAYEAWGHTSEHALQGLRFADKTEQPKPDHYLRLDTITLMCWEPRNTQPAAIAWLALDEQQRPDSVLPIMGVDGTLTYDPAYDSIWS